MERIAKELREREQNQLRRQLQPAAWRGNGQIQIEGRTYWDFAANDYLGLANHPQLKLAAIAATERYGTGAAASRLLSGSLELHTELETKIAVFKGKPSALVFNSGYQANLGILSALCQKGDVVFADRLSHASILDGVILSGAKLFRFPHNDLATLATLLEKERSRYARALLVTESVFSMDGDKAPLVELVALKEKYRCLFLVDEAHATGIWGENGSGLVAALGLTAAVDLIMGTFSKALGSFGAYLACSELVKDYLINKSRGFIYSTALPPAVIAANLASLEVVANEPQRRAELLNKAAVFRAALKARGFAVNGESQIVPVILGETARTIKISEKLRERGYWALPIRPPTVPDQQSRLRFSLSFDHPGGILRKLAADLHECYL